MLERQPPAEHPEARLVTAHRETYCADGLLDTRVMLVGYVRTAIAGQSTVPQHDALQGAGCGRVFEEAASGISLGRPQLRAALDSMREGDTLVVQSLDRLSRSPDQLMEIAKDLAGRGIGVRSLSEAIDTARTNGRLVFSEGRSFGGDTP